MTDKLRTAPRDLTLAIRVLLVVAIFVCVGVFDLGSQKPFDVVKFATVWVFGWIAFGLFLVQLVRRRERAGMSTMSWLALAFGGASAISTVLSKTKWTALFGWYGRYTGFATICVLIAIFFVVSNVYRDRPDRVRELIWALSAGAIVLMVYILMQWLRIDPIKWATTAGTVPGLKYFGTMGNADFAGGYLGLTAPCVFYAFHRADDTWKRAAVVVWGIAQLWTLWLTSARNGIAALGLAIVALIFIYRKAIPIALRVALLALFAIVVVFAGLKVVPAVTGKARATSASVLRSDTVKVRAYWWLAGLRIFEHHPIVGTGPDTYVSEYARYLPAAAAPVADSEIADKPHNVFIDHLATEGLLATGAYLVLLVIAFVRGYRRLRDGPPESRLVMTTLLALLAAYVGQAFFSIDVIPIALAGWVILGAIAALGGGSRVADEPTRPSRAIVATVVIVILSLVVATIGTFPLIADHQAHTALRITQAQGPSEDIVKFYDRARTWQPFEPLYPGSEGDFEQKQANAETDPINRRDMLAEAVAHYRKMLSLQPTYHLWMMTLAKGYGDLALAGGASINTSERWFDRAEQRAPYDWRVPTSHGDVLFAWASKTKDVDTLCRAQKEYKRANRLRRSQSAPLIGLGKTFLAIGQLKKALRPFRRAARVDKQSSTARSFVRSTEELIKSGKKYPVRSCS